MFYKFIFHSVIFMIGAIFLPSPSDHHFIWPLSNCLMADICNHTYIPECGDDDGDLRMFIDECDLFEYNCDYERNFEIVNYSECFKPATGCPTRRPCPSRPPCKNHNFHRMGDHYIYLTPERRNAMARKTPPITLPMNMLKGKRRYTPQRTKKTLHRRRITHFTTSSRRKPIPYDTTVEMVILRKETIFRNGKKVLRVVKGLAIHSGKPLKIVAEDHKSDFLEKK